MKLDIVTLEVVRNVLPAIANEMSYLLQRTSHNMMIYEVRDYCCGLLDCRGRLLAQNVGGVSHFVANLGDDSFEVRQNASAQLVAVGAGLPLALARKITVSPAQLVWLIGSIVTVGGLVVGGAAVTLNVLVVAEVPSGRVCNSIRSNSTRQGSWMKRCGA